MPHVLEIDATENVIRVSVYGDLAPAEVSDIFQRVRKFLSKTEIRGGILDLSNVRTLDIPADVVRRFSKEPPLFKGSQPRVIVAAADLVFGMARLFQISRSAIHDQLHVVHTMREAYDILGLKNPDFKTVPFEREHRENTA